MIRLLFFAAIVVLLSMAGPLHAEETALPDAITELKSMPTTEGFSALLALTTNKNIFQEWVPNLRLEPVKTVPRNTPILTLILIANPGVDGEGLAHVTYDIVIRKPDGKLYAEAPNLPGWNGRKPPAAGLVELARGTVTITIEGDDPAGRYTVEANVRDHVKGVAIKMSRTFFIAK